MSHRGMVHRRTARRRAIAVVSMAIFALTVAFAVPGLMAGAGATIANPGTVGVSIDVSILTPTATISGLSTTATATILSDGLLTIPRTAMAFAPATATIGAPASTTSPITVQLVATGDFKGRVNPQTGGELLAGGLELFLSQSGTLSDCPVGPFAVHFTTIGPGTAPYSPVTGKAMIVDASAAIAAVQPGTPGCAGYEDFVNSTLSLPLVPTTTTTGSSTTTTTVPPTATTVPGTPLPNTPVPALVAATTLSPPPRAGLIPIFPPPTTAGPPTTASATTVPSFGPPPTAVTNPTPSGNRPGSGHHRSSHHKKRSTAKKPSRRIVARRPGSGSASGINPRYASGRSGNASARAGSGSRAGSSATSAAALEQGRVQAIDAQLISSIRREGPTTLNVLAFFLIAVTGAFAIKLMTPDLKDVARARKKGRGRLYGIRAASDADK